MQADEFDQLDGIDLARLVRTGEVSAIELLKASLTRIEQYGLDSNLVVSVFEKAARRRAREGLPAGPFQGVPILLKDLMAHRDGPTRMGSRAFRDQRITAHSAYLEKIEAAGFNVVGKTHTTEFGLSPIGRTVLHGEVRNPWAPGRDTGGSSAGAAASVAARILPIAQGGDGGGSIRIPASACGVFGLKPSRGRVTSAPNSNIDGNLVHHVLTVSVRDSAAFLDAVKGNSPGDRWTREPAPSYLDCLSRPPCRLRIGVASHGFEIDGIDPVCVRAVEDAAKLCEQLGHRVEVCEISSAHAFVELFLDIVAISCARTVDARLENPSRSEPAEELFEPETLILAERGRTLGLGAWLPIAERVQAEAYALSGPFLDFDMLLTPVLSSPPVRLDTFPPHKGSGCDPWKAIAAYTPHTEFANATGQPAMSVPLYWSDGLPIGVQFIGTQGREDLLLQLAQELESARPWRKKIPPYRECAGEKLHA